MWKGRTHQRKGAGSPTWCQALTAASSPVGQEQMAGERCQGPVLCAPSPEGLDVTQPHSDCARSPWVGGDLSASLRIKKGINLILHLGTSEQAGRGKEQVQRVGDGLDLHSCRQGKVSRVPAGEGSPGWQLPPHEVPLLCPAPRTSQGTDRGAKPCRGSATNAPTCSLFTAAGDECGPSSSRLSLLQ